MSLVRGTISHGVGAGATHLSIDKFYHGLEVDSNTLMRAGVASVATSTAYLGVDLLNNLLPSAVLGSVGQSVLAPISSGVMGALALQATGLGMQGPVMDGVQIGVSDAVSHYVLNDVLKL
jgi:hypothetical protein